MEACGVNEVLFGLEADAKTRYLHALEDCEKLWREKSRNKWLREGDRNSKFFHLSTVIRRSKNQIKCLKKDDGTVVADLVGMAEYVCTFFKNFHKAVPLAEHMDLLDVIPNVLGDDDRVSLEVDPELDEVKNAVWDLDPDSSPRLDGFQGAFFRRCWEIVGTDVGRAVVNFFREGIMPKGMNNYFISLIPKVEGVISLDKFCPICMGNFICKIISKILANRLGALLPCLVSKEQGAFQKGKVIFSNICMASEMSNLMHKAMRGGGIGLKLDV
ncbi:uncharacterized protein LOC122650735 [Telopea speciosissima]|uniref:uncharacterized protein LOC122650735 n=1 Tax=Telopea speciosissima TaxID=54955 RepID=UPI001CC5E765|nr:uncharacterized protein LOC122650735 [Telopea speciosissima]